MCTHDFPSEDAEQKKIGQSFDCLWSSDEARTRYLHLGKVALYRMSYTRISNADMIIADFFKSQGPMQNFPKKSPGGQKPPSTHVSNLRG